MKYRKNLEIWKRLGNLEKVWIFGKGLEILKKKNWKIWQKKLKFGNFEKKKLENLEKKI